MLQYPEVTTTSLNNPTLCFICGWNWEIRAMHHHQVWNWKLTHMDVLRKRVVVLEYRWNDVPAVLIQSTSSKMIARCKILTWHIKEPRYDVIGEWKRIHCLTFRHWWRTDQDFHLFPGFYQISTFEANLRKIKQKRSLFIKKALSFLLWRVCNNTIIWRIRNFTRERCIERTEYKTELELLYSRLAKSIEGI